VLGLCLVMAFGVLDPLGASRARADVATLKKIASKVEPLMGIVTIEASDPVAYVASQPDPLTFVLELRHVVSAGYADQFKAHPGHPVSAVRVESTHAPDGGELARVHLTLTQPIRPRVKSSRNVISVEADRAPTAEATVNLGGAVAAIRDVRVTRRGDATAITLLATGRLAASGVQEETKGARRLLIDLPNTSSAVKSLTTINEGPVGTVRIGANPKSPLLTQVAMDLTRPSSYRVESSPDGTSLTVVFDEPAVDPVAALRAAPAAKTAVAPVAPAPTAAPRVPPAARGTARVPQASAADSSPAPKYTGHPVSLDFQGADLRAVLRTFAEISGLNIVIDPTISGSVDVALRDVPWDQALDIILRSNRLGYVVDATIVRVAPLDTLATEEKERLKLVDAQAQAGELRVLTRALSYATTKDLAKLLEETVLSKRGTIQEHVPTNTLIINDLSDRLERASELIAVLDVPPPQVEIEARIVQTTREFARTLGVQWGFNARANLGDSLDAFSTGATGRLQPPAGLPGPGNVVGTAVNLATGGATSALAVALTGAVNLDIALSALEKQGQGRILSTPRVSTQNNIEAEITQGIQIPIQTVANNTVTVTFKDAALTLRVKPQITASNTVIMQISVENAAPDFSRQVNFIPPIDTQRANTRVLVNNGETTVIGGIYVSREQALQDRTPGVHRVPILGWLFKRDSIQDENRELLIFITPRIMQI
jgi:type IV pilus assembly protein PilQ